MKSDPGVFTVHRLKEKIYYEIPKSELDKEFLWVSQIAKTTLGVGYGGQALGRRVVRWERNGNRVLLGGVRRSAPRQPGVVLLTPIGCTNRARAAAHGVCGEG